MPSIKHLPKLADGQVSSQSDPDTSAGSLRLTPLANKPPLRRALIGPAIKHNGPVHAAVRPASLATDATTATHRGGYVTCAVCDITKFYASVQRRYGQFTCMGCAKFFGRFLLKPRRYFCPNLGK